MKVRELIEKLFGLTEEQMDYEVFTVFWSDEAAQERLLMNFG